MPAIELTPVAPQSSELPNIEITSTAVAQVKRLIAKQGKPGLGLRLGVKGGGCSGLSYVLGLEADPRQNDHVLERDGIRVFIDRKSARFIDGITLDYSLKNLLEGGWVFTNPNAARSCGCGTSFTPKG